LSKFSSPMAPLSRAGYHPAAANPPLAHTKRPGKFSRRIFGFTADDANDDVAALFAHILLKPNWP
jgi:hypothetical protein